MKTQENINRLYERRKTCGSFESSLIDAYLNADGSNSRILEEAFRGTRFDLLPKPRFDHGIETLRAAVRWANMRDEGYNFDKTAEELLEEYEIWADSTDTDCPMDQHFLARLQ